KPEPHAPDVVRRRVGHVALPRPGYADGLDHLAALGAAPADAEPLEVVAARPARTRGGDEGVGRQTGLQGSVPRNVPPITPAGCPGPAPSRSGQPGPGLAALGATSRADPNRVGHGLVAERLDTH